MDSGINYIHTIIAKSLTEKLDNQESKELDDWRSASTSNLREYNDFTTLWLKSGSMSMPSAINKQNALKKIQQNSSLPSSRKRLINITYQIAAVLVLSIIFSGVFTYLNNDRIHKYYANAISQPIYQEIKAAYGTQSKVELSDGTIVFLNSGSKLRFPQTFINQDERKVSLDGEGYFSVAKNPNQPFIVEAKNLNVKVLGTTFNMEAYDDNSSVTIALVEGNVSLQSQSENEKTELMQLSPNQVATFNKSENLLSKTVVSDLYKYTAWINGRIVFDNDPIETVVNKLGKWYNVDITIADKKLSNYSFTATFMDESLEQILDVLSLTSSMTYKIESPVKQTDDSMSKRKVILKSKNLN